MDIYCGTEGESNSLTIFAFLFLVLSINNLLDYSIYTTYYYVYATSYSFQK